MFSKLLKKCTLQKISLLGKHKVFLCKESQHRMIFWWCYFIYIKNSLPRLKDQEISRKNRSEFVENGTADDQNTFS